MPVPLPLMNTTPFTGSSYQLRGGGKSFTFPVEELDEYIIGGVQNVALGDQLKYLNHVEHDTLGKYSTEKGFVHSRNPVDILSTNASIMTLKKLAQIHHIKIGSMHTSNTIALLFENHSCINCSLYYSVFVVVQSRRKKEKKAEKNVMKIAFKVEHQLEDQTAGLNEIVSSDFLPPPANKSVSERIIREFCTASSTENIEEDVCAVCGTLQLIKHLMRLKNMKGHLEVLTASGVTHQERKKVSDPILEYNAPVFSYTCSKICDTCRKKVMCGRVPGWLWQMDCGLEIYPRHFHISISLKGCW